MYKQNEHGRRKLRSHIEKYLNMENGTYKQLYGVSLVFNLWGFLSPGKSHELNDLKSGTHIKFVTSSIFGTLNATMTMLLMKKARPVPKLIAGCSVFCLTALLNTKSILLKDIEFCNNEINNGILERALEDFDKSDIQAEAKRDSRSKTKAS